MIEPNDTSKRTSNLQQTNTNGYKFQGTQEQFLAAKKLFESWGPTCLNYSNDPLYQLRMHDLKSRFPYRLDTNFAKIDRIAHKDIEAFKRRVLASEVHGISIKRWAQIFGHNDQVEIE